MAKVPGARGNVGTYPAKWSREIATAASGKGNSGEEHGLACSQAAQRHIDDTWVAAKPPTPVESTEEVVLSLHLRIETFVKQKGPQRDAGIVHALRSRRAIGVGLVSPFRCQDAIVDFLDGDLA
jgi:hypothetical protein